MIVPLLLPVLLSAAVDADGRTLGELLAAATSQVAGVEVSTMADLRDVVALQGEKQAAGCDDAATNACMAEVAHALGARYALISELGSLGDERTLSLNLLDVEAAKTASRQVLRGKDVADLGHQIDAAVPRLFRGVREGRVVILDTRSSGAAAEATQPETPSSSGPPWLAIGGGAVAGLGVVGVGLAVVGEVVIAGQQASLEQDGSDRLTQLDAAALTAARDGNAGLTRIAWIAGGSALVVGSAVTVVGLVVGGGE